MPLPAVPRPRPGSAPAFPRSFPPGHWRNDGAKAAAQFPCPVPRGTTPKLGVKRGNAAAAAFEGETCPCLYGQTDSNGDVPARYPREL